MSTHYTAVIEIVKRVKVEPVKLNRPYNEAPANIGVDEKKEVARIVIRAASIPALTAKCAAHLALVEDV